MGWTPPACLLARELVPTILLVGLKNNPVHFGLIQNEPKNQGIMQKSISSPGEILISYDKFESWKNLRLTRLFCPMLSSNAQNRTFIKRKRYVRKRLVGAGWKTTPAGRPCGMPQRGPGKPGFHGAAAWVYLFRDFFTGIFLSLKKSPPIHFKKRISLIGFIPILGTFSFYYDTVQKSVSEERHPACCLGVIVWK